MGGFALYPKHGSRQEWATIQEAVYTPKRQGRTDQPPAQDKEENTRASQLIKKQKIAKPKEPMAFSSQMH
jgi:hypothetical protein